MRIAYITNYQGSSLPERRPIVKNRSLSNRVKIELIASLLCASSHQVEVLSHGEVVENKLRFYPSFCEASGFHPDIPVRYASALPVRRINGLWSSTRTLQLFRSRHRVAPFDLMLIFNLKEPQIACARYAMRLQLPVILQYEDDWFVNISGGNKDGFLHNYRCRSRREVLEKVSGCIAVSPHLHTQVPERTPKMLLRAAVDSDVLDAGRQCGGNRQNWILFSGTHTESNGVAQLIEAWRRTSIPGWEVHITGYGQLTESLRQMAADVPGVVFHGMVPREKLVELLSSAKICINPHTVSETPGNVFAFKIIEYLAAGAHCVTTPMGALAPDIEAGISYMSNNSPETIAATLMSVIKNRRYERLATDAARDRYGRQAVSQSLDSFVKRVLRQYEMRSGVNASSDTVSSTSGAAHPLTDAGHSDSGSSDAQQGKAIIRT
jgi:glycosyltransferase involved in cell wall biosynthesis